MAYGDFKDLAKRTGSEKILRDKTFNVAKNSKYHGYQRGLASMVYRFLDRKFAGSGIKNEITQNQQLAAELHKRIIRKFLKRRVYSSSKTIIWGANLANMKLISNFNKKIRFLLCAIDIYSKFIWVIPLKDKKV